MDLVAVTKKMLWQLVEHERNSGKEYTLQGAIASYLYDRLRGTEKSQREYAQIWGWGRKKVRLNWGEIEATGALLEVKNEVFSRGPLRAQNSRETKQNRNIGAHEGPTTNIDTTSIPLTTAIPNRGGGTESAREKPPPPPPDEEPVAPVVDDLSWLPENDQVYAPTIAELLTDYKPSNADQMLVHTWRQHSRVPLSSVHELLKTYPWPVFVAGVVIASDDRRPNLKFLQAILKRLTAHRHEHSQEIIIGADQPAGSHTAGGGAVIHRLETGGSGSLPTRVRTGAAGGAAGTAGSAAYRKREGELTFREYLIRSGHPPAFVASLTDEQVARFLATGTFGEPAGGGGSIDAARLPVRACAER